MSAASPARPAAAALTVVVPVHDGARFLADTLESLRRQTVALHEVIVVDDASSDGSADLAAAHPLRPRVVRLDRNRGVAFARNTGLLEAATDHVAFLDQDDLWLPGRAARLAAAVAAGPADRVVVTSERVFAAAEDRAALDGHPFAGWVEFWRPRDAVLDLLDDVPEQPATPPEPVTRQRLLGGSVTVTTSYVLPRRLALQVGGFAAWVRAADDWILLQTLTRHTSVVRLDEPSVLYRVHPANTSVRTDWPMPLVVSAAATRFGGGVVAVEDARSAAQVGRLTDSDFLMHHLDARAGTPGLRARADVFAAWQLLATDRPDRIASGRRLVRSFLRSVLPTRIRTLLRRLR